MRPSPLLRRLGPLALIVALVTTLVAPTAAVAEDRRDTSVRAKSRLTADELYAWWSAQPSFSRYSISRAPRDLVGLYEREGRNEGIAWDLAFVQSIHETGWFGFGGQVKASDNNFAGMGAYDSSGGEWVFRFPTPGMGVRAQMQHLRLYSDPGTNLAGTNLGSSLARDEGNRYPDRWRTVRAIRTPYGDYRYAGKVRTWEDFGNGMWATDRAYTCKVLNTYRQALAFNGKSTKGLPTAVDCQRAWYFRNSNSGGGHHVEGRLGRAGEQVLACDIDGSGRDTPVTFHEGRWWISPDLDDGPTASGPPMITRYGRAGDHPICGDWDGDGRDTLGIIRGGQWHLIDDLVSNHAHRTFTYGRIDRGDVPLVGDWNADGRDTIGIVRGGEWHLRNALAPGFADHTFVYGRVRDGDVPVIGDWDRDGRVGVGIVRGDQWHLRNTLTAGNADTTFAFGRAGDTPVVGDWNGDGRTTPAAVR